MTGTQLRGAESSCGGGAESMRDEREHPESPGTDTRRNRWLRVSTHMDLMGQKPGVYRPAFGLRETAGKLRYGGHAPSYFEELGETARPQRVVPPSAQGIRPENPEHDEAVAYMQRLLRGSIPIPGAARRRKKHTFKVRWDCIPWPSRRRS